MGKINSKQEYRLIIKKSVVPPFYAKRHGKLSRITGWMLPEKSYKPDEKGVMNFIADHLGMDKYKEVISREAKESTYLLEAVNNVLLEITDKGKDDLTRMVRADKASVKQLMSVMVDKITSDVEQQGVSLQAMEGKEPYDSTWRIRKV